MKKTKQFSCCWRHKWDHNLNVKTFLHSLRVVYLLLKSSGIVLQVCALLLRSRSLVFVVSRLKILLLYMFWMSFFALVNWEKQRHCQHIFESKIGNLFFVFHFFGNCFVHFRFNNCQLMELQWGVNCNQKSFSESSDFWIRIQSKHELHGTAVIMNNDLDYSVSHTKLSYGFRRLGMWW